MRGAKPARRSNSASTSRRAGSGARRSTGGKKRSSSTPPMLRRTTISRSRTNMRDSSKRRARPTKKPSSSSRTTLRFVRTTSCSRKSMTGPVPTPKGRKLALAAFAAALAAIAIGCGTSYYEIPIETPIQPKMDVSPFQRVLVAGFVAGGNDDVDANQETVRLLRSQLRTKSQLKVIDADLLPLMEVAAENGGPSEQTPASDTVVAQQPPPAPGVGLPRRIKEEKDLEPYERLFANTAYWKRIGEEFQNPLIVTGTVLFSPHTRSGYVQRDQEGFDQYGRRMVRPVRMYMERKGFILRPKFIFIDGRTGATMYSESYREEILYNAQQNTPALSSYFELMDRLVPNFLSALSSQKIKGTRVLLK